MYIKLIDNNSNDYLIMAILILNDTSYLIEMVKFMAAFDIASTLFNAINNQFRKLIKILLQAKNSRKPHKINAEHDE